MWNPYDVSFLYTYIYLFIKKSRIIPTWEYIPIATADSRNAKYPSYLLTQMLKKISNVIKHKMITIVFYVL